MAAELDPGLFVPLEVIMHPIPAGRADREAEDVIRYSEVPLELNAEDKGFLQRRLRAALGGYARPVRESPDSDSAVPQIVKDLLTSSDQLVPHSCTIARDLHLSQKAVSPDGLVMTIIGQVAQTRCAVIAKMEHQEGMRVEQVTDNQGRRTFRAQHLRNLILGEGTRIFKVGAFALDPAGHLDGYAVDDQQSAGGIAHYFVDFLGCEFTVRADLLTEKFMNASQKFVAVRTAQDAETSARYEIALLAELQKDSANVVPKTFASDHLDVKDRDDYLQQLREVGVPANGFRKDVTLIKSQIRRMRITTERGADVYAPPELYEDGTLTVQRPDDGAHRIIVTDTVHKITGASGPKKTNG